MARRREITRKLMHFGELVSHSATTPLEGETRKPIAANQDELGVTFIGHSSFLIQIGGRNLLIDPVFAQWLIVLRRMRRPGVRVPDLPPIDAVLLTHAHMDHLNRPSLRAIVRHTVRIRGKAPVAIVPWGVKDLIHDLGFSEIRSLEWWQAADLNGVEITLTPARHWGARLFNDTHRGYGGYVLQSNGHSLYHSGDTAYFQGFRQIGERFTPEVALLPIGAYQPETYRSVHTSPEDALMAFLDLGARWMIPMHYGTFRLSQEPVEEPVPRLLEAARRAGVEDCMSPLTEGQTRIFTAQDYRAELPEPELSASA